MIIYGSGSRAQFSAVQFSSVQFLPGQSCTYAFFYFLFFYILVPSPAYKKHSSSLDKVTNSLILTAFGVRPVEVSRLSGLVPGRDSGPIVPRIQTLYLYNQIVIFFFIFMNLKPHFGIIVSLPLKGKSIQQYILSHSVHCLSKPRSAISFVPCYPLRPRCITVLFPNVPTTSFSHVLQALHGLHDLEGGEGLLLNFPTLVHVSDALCHCDGYLLRGHPVVLPFSLRGETRVTLYKCGIYVVYTLPVDSLETNSFNGFS